MATGVCGGVLVGMEGFDVAADLFWALFFAGLLRWSLHPAGRRFWSGWLGVALAFVGVFSYSLYAIHGPVLELTYRLISPNPSQKFASLWPAMGAVVIAVACAWLFFQLVERWSIRPTTAPVRRDSHGK